MMSYGMLDDHINSAQWKTEVYSAWFLKRYKKQNQFLLDLHMTIRDYINAHPEYYECPIE